MRQRLGLAAALLRRPRLLVLDEPTNGLDPQGIREVRTLLVDLAHGGTTVFLSSHLLGEVEAFCGRAAIVHRGRLVAQDRVDALLAPTGTVWVETPDADRAVAVVVGLRRPSVEHTDRLDGLRIRLGGMAPEDLNAAFVGSGVRVRELVRERLSLEEVFIRLTGETTRVDR
jgi:ABC-2 type transport system ATP-binding protein